LPGATNRCPHCAQEERTGVKTAPTNIDQKVRAAEGEGEGN